MAKTSSCLLLGAGFVVKPTLEILAESGIQVTVACRTLQSAKSLSQGVPNSTAISLDVEDEKALDAEAAKHDVLISLIPYTFHAAVIKAGIRNRKHVVTTSYVSPAMMELDAECKKAGITVMNEIGLDPGIDHLYAVKTIDEVHRAGGKVTKFISMCGGLPAPEYSDNPLGYKFSWSPRGVLLAARNDASFYEDGKVVKIPGSELMGSAKPYFIYPGYAFEGYANRDSTPFKQRYQIPEAETILRGSLRYQGNPALVRVLADLGFLKDDKREYLTKPIAWSEATAQIIGASSGDSGDLEAAVSSKTKFANETEQGRILNGLKWIGLFSNDKIKPRGTPLDVLCAELESRCAYGPGERDLVMLQHKFYIENKDGSKEIRTSTLCENGIPNGRQAMAKLVGIPCAVAVQQVLDGRISDRGILAPMTPKICDPLREELKKTYGIEMIEKTLA